MSDYSWFLDSMATDQLRKELQFDDASLGRRIDRLEEQLDRVSLLALASWSLLKERGDVDDEQLLDRMQELDLQDGREDGRTVLPRKAGRRCLDCDRDMAESRRRCLYCGGGPSHAT